MKSLIGALVVGTIITISPQSALPIIAAVLTMIYIEMPKEE